MHVRSYITVGGANIHPYDGKMAASSVYLGTYTTKASMLSLPLYTGDLSVSIGEEILARLLMLIFNL